MHGTPDPDAAIDLRDVTAGYQQGVAVLEGLTARFGPRGVVLVRGRNGAGKSTLLEVCSGYLRPWRGAVRIAGMDAATAAARTRRRVCRTEPALYPNMTARDHLVFAARCLGVDPAPGLARAERYGLAPWLGYDAKSLSTGNRRKLWIIMCTLGSFDVVILDEPFNGLDPAGRDTLSAEIRHWSATAAVLLISHAPPAGVEADREFTVGGSAGG
jgi:ABC-type multidrug transport system ATPase subunit